MKNKNTLFNCMYKDGFILGYGFKGLESRPPLNTPYFGADFGSKLENWILKLGLLFFSRDHQDSRGK